MKKEIGFAMTLFLMANLAQAQSFTQTRTPDDFIAELRASMKDPSSFVLDATYSKTYTLEEQTKDASYVPKKDKTMKAWIMAHVGLTDYCFEYHAKNSYGAYNREAEFTGFNNAGVQVLSLSGDSCNRPGLNFKLVSVTAPTAATAADKAKQAQKYADCLKLAVDNPTIVCKQ